MTNKEIELQHKIHGIVSDAVGDSESFGYHVAKITDLVEAASEDTSVLFGEWISGQDNMFICTDEDLWINLEDRDTNKTYTTSELYQIFNTKKEG